MDIFQLQRIYNFLGIREVKKQPNPVRIGIIGASQVSTYALIWPARSLPDVDVVAVAARDADRAEKFAKQQKVSRSYGSYDELLKDPDVDAVYIGLPNGLHGEWSKKALLSGKHVLCEKPFTANEKEAKEVHALARKKGLLCREAFHYREHPLMTRCLEVVQGGTIGQVRHMTATLLMPKWLFPDVNIQAREQNAGGAMMEAGCYCVHALRALSGSQLYVDNSAARMVPGSQVLDAAMVANLRWKDQPQLTARLHASLSDKSWFPITELAVIGTKGSLKCTGFIVPFLGNSLHIRTHQYDGSTSDTTEHVYGNQDTTYSLQLRRFVSDLQVFRNHATNGSGARSETKKTISRLMDVELKDSVANMRVVDEAYVAAGLPKRLPALQYVAAKSMGDGAEYESRMPKFMPAETCDGDFSNRAEGSDISTRV